MRRPKYNYRHFEPEHYDCDDFAGIDVGERMPDLELVTLERRRVRLSDWLGQRVVLESGSISCPVFVGNIPLMNELAREFSDAAFLVLYTRETHPGGRVDAHTSLDEKLDAARALQSMEGERRTILVDEVGGRAHRILGGTPNLTYVLDENHLVVCCGPYNQPEMVRLALEGASRRELDAAKRKAMRPHPPGLLVSLRVLRRAGPRAVWEFVKGLPRMLPLYVRRWRS